MKTTNILHFLLGGDEVDETHTRYTIFVLLALSLKKSATESCSTPCYEQCRICADECCSRCTMHGKCLSCMVAFVDTGVAKCKMQKGPLIHVNSETG